MKNISPSQYVEQCVCPFGYSGPSCEVTEPIIILTNLAVTGHSFPELSYGFRETSFSRISRQNTFFKFYNVRDNPLIN